MRWIVGIICFFIMVTIFDSFKARTIQLEERVKKLEEIVESHCSDEDE